MDATLDSMKQLLSGSLGGASGGSRLERELVLGFELEHKRKAEDTMKKRAIHTAGSYDEFKNLVAAATQKPLSQSDYGTKAVTSVNKMLSGEAVRGSAKEGQLGLGLQLPGCEGAAQSETMRASSVSISSDRFGLPPASPGEFERTWRRLSAEKRTAYLSWLGPTRLGYPFRRDIEGTILGAIILELGGGDIEVWEGSRGREAVVYRLDLLRGILEATPPSSLGLAVDTLSREEREAANALKKASKCVNYEYNDIIERLD